MKIYFVYMPSWEEKADEICCFSTKKKAEKFIERLAERPDCKKSFFEILEKNLDSSYEDNERIIFDE